MLQDGCAVTSGTSRLRFLRFLELAVRIYTMHVNAPCVTKDITIDIKSSFS
jgi:hypothetical protein